MKHVFVVETADDDLISPLAIDKLTGVIEIAVEDRVRGIANATSICNQPSAVRAIYRLYQLDQSQSPDQLGCSK